MKKKCIISVLFAVFLFSGICYFTVYQAYDQTSSSHGFLIPKEAELISKMGNSEVYNWSKASEENGIPLAYEFMIKNNGWEKGEREGAAVIYTKNDEKIELLSMSEQLTVILINNEVER